jgi:hypothetical protein
MFLKQVWGLYSTFEPAPERVQAWARNLSEIEYDTAIKRLDKYAAFNQYPPTLANILNPERIGEKKRPPDEGSSPAAIINGGYAPLYCVKDDE